MGLLSTKLFCVPHFFGYRKQPSSSLHDLPWVSVSKFEQLLIRKRRGCKGLPQGSVGKESTCNTRYTRDVGLTPGPGRSLGGGNGNPPQYSCLKNPMDRGACGLQSLQTVWHNWATKHACMGCNTRERQTVKSRLEARSSFCISGYTQQLSLSYSAVTETPSRWLEFNN